MTAETSGRMVSKVAVFMGGPSAEREVQTSSGRECAKSLQEAGYKVIEAGHVPPPHYVVRPYKQGALVGVCILHPACGPQCSVFVEPHAADGGGQNLCAGARDDFGHACWNRSYRSGLR